MLTAIIFLAIGALLLIQAVLKIDLPIARSLFGIFLVYLGLKVIFGGFGMHLRVGESPRRITETEVIFGEGSLRAKDVSGKTNREFRTVFGESRVDLTQLSPADLSQPIRITTVFGETNVLTPADWGVEAKVHAALGSVTLRGQKAAGIVETTLETPSSGDSSRPALKLEVQSVFGSTEIR